MTLIKSKFSVKNNNFFLALTIIMGLAIHGTIFAIMLHYGEGSLVNKVSISPKFDKQFFHTKVFFCTAFL